MSSAVLDSLFEGQRRTFREHSIKCRLPPRVHNFNRQRMGKGRRRRNQAMPDLELWRICAEYLSTHISCVYPKCRDVAFLQGNRNFKEADFRLHPSAGPEAALGVKFNLDSFNGV